MPPEKEEQMSNPVTDKTATPSESVTLLRRPAKGKDALSCWMAIPSNMSPEAIPLVAVHGIQRGAKQQAQLLAPQAALLGRPVVAPLFNTKNWPRYQQVVRGKRADLALLQLMNELRLAGIWQTQKFELSGYSGGAQFAHRFAMLYPQLVARLTVSSAGWYTFPDEAAFPYGMASRPGRKNDWGPRFASGLEQFLEIPIKVCVGSKDCVADPNTRNGTEIDQQQGEHRVMRAKRWAAALRQVASAKGISAQVGLSIMPDCGHDFGQCVRLGGLDRLILDDDGAGLEMPRPHHWDQAPATTAAQP